MKKILLFIAFICCTQMNALIAQTHDGDVWLASQSEVNDFVAENYTAVDGYLLFDDSDSDGSDPITDVSGFNNLVSVSENLSFGRLLALESISGFDALESVSDLTFYENSSVQSIEGFNNLSTIASYMEINENPALETISGFENLATIGTQGSDESISALLITYNESLTSVSGFDALTQVGLISFSSNASLELISGFDSFTDHAPSVDESISESEPMIIIVENPSIQDLSFLSSLNRVHMLTMGDIPLIVDLNFLCGLVEVAPFGDSDGILTINATTALTDCYALCGIPAFLNGHILSGGSGDCSDSFTLENACDNADDNCDVGTSDKILTGVTLSPNPTLEFFEIKGLQGNSRIELSSIDGRLLKRIIANDDLRMDISDYETGIYIAKVIDLETSRQVVYRVVKK